MDKNDIFKKINKMIAYNEKELKLTLDEIERFTSIKKNLKDYDPVEIAKLAVLKDKALAQKTAIVVLKQVLEGTE